LKLELNLGVAGVSRALRRAESVFRKNPEIKLRLYYDCLTPNLRLMASFLFLRSPSSNHCQRIFAKYCRFQPDIFSLDKE
jgi:hypothetical protein